MSLKQLFSLSLIEIVGDTGALLFANHGGIFNLGIGILGYIGIFIMLIINLQGSKLMLVNAGWDGLNALINSIYTFFILGERLESKSQYLGIFFIIGGIWLLKIPLSKTNSFKWPKL